MVIGSDYAQFYFMSRSKQSTNLASISSTNLMELPVVLPPTEEQKAIVSFLVSTLPRMEALITKSERAIDLLQERRTALISAAVTGQIDVRHAAPSSITLAREDQSFSKGARPGLISPGHGSGKPPTYYGQALKARPIYI